VGKDFFPGLLVIQQIFSACAFSFSLYELRPHSCSCVRIRIVVHVCFVIVLLGLVRATKLHSLLDQQPGPDDSGMCMSASKSCGGSSVHRCVVDKLLDGQQQRILVLVLLLIHV
jgi:hypothetical protein